MSGTKTTLWIDLVMILFGIVTLLLLFMPNYYRDYRYAGYITSALFLVFLAVREYRRKRKDKHKKEK